jgi:hypothetical protein
MGTLATRQKSMALIFLGQSKCMICGNILEEGEEVVGLPPISNTAHQLYKYFDSGIHSKCFETWDKKNEVKSLIKAEKEKFKNSDHFKKIVANHVYPKWLDEEPWI